jgi:hypothetical protein
MPGQWNDKVFGVKEENFEALALEVFLFQSENNPVYKDFLQALNVDPATVREITRIPFLPVRFFKSHEIRTTSFEPEAVFVSSGTSGSSNSRHFIKELSLYEESFTKGFGYFYGPVENYAFFALLPSYLEQPGSSLVYMVGKLIELSKNDHSRFYLGDDELTGWIQLREHFLAKPGYEEKKNILLGVTYALLDFAKKKSWQLNNTIIMETGGMKGRKKEMIRSEVHDVLKTAFGVKAVHSEYGMTELLSQAYSKGEGIFNCPPWMKILMRDEEDPFLVKRSGSGTINVIDLANIYSCSFIATDDLGKLYPDRSFEVLGRMDGSDLRGCSLMVV